jgi:hypothetical protein
MLAQLYSIEKILAKRQNTIKSNFQPIQEQSNTKLSGKDTPYQPPPGSQREILNISMIFWTNFSRNIPNFSLITLLKTMLFL